MSFELVKKYAPATDELFKAESKTNLITNTDFDWSGAHTVVIWKISTVGMNDYARNRYEDDVLSDDSVACISRYGKLYDLDTQIEEMILKKDRSFIFNVDRMDGDETSKQLEAGKALARQLRNVVIPEVDTYTYKVMVENAGTTAEASVLTPENIYDAIAAGNEVMDDSEVPETGRVIVVTPKVYTIMKKAKIFDNTDIGADMKLKGVIAEVDGLQVVKVPENRLPEKFGFMIAHPCATVAPVKLEDYGTHDDTPLSSGTIVTGRIVYDAFVMDNKKAGIYYHPIA